MITPRTTLSVLLGGLLLAASAGIAFAQQSAPAATPAPRQSIEARMKARFDAADADHDGYLSRDEVQKSLPHLASQFDAIDANKDGKLSPDEVKAAAGRMMHARGPHGGPHGGKPHMPGGMWWQADANHDRVITRDELQAYTQKLTQDFDAADTNKDGQLTADEMKAWHDKMRPSRTPRPASSTPAN